MTLALILFITGLVLLIYGADRFVLGAAALANMLNAPRAIVGTIALSMGTALPTLAFSLTAAMNGKTDMVIGNVLGTNIAHSLLIFGCAAVIHPLDLRSKRLKREAPLFFLLTLLSGFFLFDNQLTRSDGAILLIIFTALIAGITMMNRSRLSAQGDMLSLLQKKASPKTINPRVAFLAIIIGLILFPVAAKIMFDNAIVIAHHLGLSELIISLTLVTIGTSLPELTTAIAGVRKREEVIVPGSIMGSNLFNLYCVLGLSVLIAPGEFSSEAFWRDYWVMLAASLALMILCIHARQRVTQHIGMSLLICFMLYLGALTMSALV